MKSDKHPVLTHFTEIIKFKENWYRYLITLFFISLGLVYWKQILVTIKTFPLWVICVYAILAGFILFFHIGLWLTVFSKSSEGYYLHLTYEYLNYFMPFIRQINSYLFSLAISVYFHIIPAYIIAIIMLVVLLFLHLMQLIIIVNIDE